MISTSLLLSGCRVLMATGHSDLNGRWFAEISGGALHERRKSFRSPNTAPDLVTDSPGTVTWNAACSEVRALQAFAEKALHGVTVELLERRHELPSYHASRRQIATAVSEGAKATVFLETEGR